jgi:glutamate/tyrosine decarboxylase-like PLP-dependent enzyme
MNAQLHHDWQHQDQILETAVYAANQFLKSLPERPAAAMPKPGAMTDLPETGLGAEAALAQFRAAYEAQLAATAGPRYFGFVTGGTTPAAFAGDWLTAVYDQNAASDHDSIAAHVEQEALRFLRQLFGLPDEFAGTFVSGATMSNFVGLSQARQWAALQMGVDTAVDGLYGLLPIPVLSGTPHSSSYKSLAMLGIGKNNVMLIPTLPKLEAMDI